MADKDSDDRSLKKKLNDPEYMVSMTLTVFSQIFFLLQFFITNNNTMQLLSFIHPKTKYIYQYYRDKQQTLN